MEPALEHTSLGRSGEYSLHVLLFYHIYAKEDCYEALLTGGKED